MDYRGRRHGRLHSPRAERMAEKSPSTPIASSVQTKKKCPLVLASLLVMPVGALAGGACASLIGVTPTLAVFAAVAATGMSVTFRRPSSPQPIPTGATAADGLEAEERLASRDRSA